MTPDSGDLIVRDLGSTNGIRINGQRVEEGRLKVGDELSIAHIRFRLDNGQCEERTVAATLGGGQHAWHLSARERVTNGNAYPGSPQTPPRPASTDDSPLAAAVLERLPSEVADRARKIEVIVHMKPDSGKSPASVAVEPHAEPCPPVSPP
jgi:hypothetical protein